MVIFYYTPHEALSAVWSHVFIILVNGVTDHIISTLKCIIQNLVLDIYFHVSSILFIYFTALGELGPFVNQFHTPKQFVHMSKGVFSQEMWRIKKKSNFNFQL